MNGIAYTETSDFELVDPEMTHLASGGLHLQIAFGGNSRINSGCVADVQNQFCFAPNTFCAADTLCVEII